MVARLPPPQPDDLKLIQKIIEERANGLNANYFTGISSYWISRISEYNQKLGNPENIAASAISNDDSSKYINLYSHATEDNCQFDPIRKLRNPKPKLLYCPGCGEDGTPRTLDHYLPKKKFPEFAVHLKNLVPMCDICQGIKGENYLDENGKQIFFHAYFDPIPLPLAYIEISPPYSTPTDFKLKVPDFPDKIMTERVKRHIKGLNLSERIEEFCNEKYMHLLKLVSTNRKQSTMSITESLKQFLFIEEQKTSNGWAALFYRSVMKNPNLLDYLQNGELPNFLDT